MSTITLTNTFTDGTTAKADEVMANLTDITDVVNGSIDGDNISTSSALSVASIATSGNAAITGNAAVTGTLEVTSTTTLTGAQTLTGATTCNGGIILGADKGITHKVMARAYLSADQDGIANNTWTIVNLDTESYDVGSDFNTTTHEFTIPVTGYYLVNACVYWENTDILADKNYGAAIYHDPLGAGSDAAIAQNLNQSSVAGKYITCNISDVYKFTATDTVHLRCWHDDGTGNPDIESGANNTYFSIMLISV
jgi:hypothetical protein